MTYIHSGWSTERSAHWSQAREEAAGRDGVWVGFQEAESGVGFLCK